MKTILRYAGGKSKAYNLITPYITSERVVSPFIGGGSMESRWASELGKEVIGYDIFNPLVIFWNQLLSNNQNLADLLTTLTPDNQTYDFIKNKLMCWDYTQYMLKDWKTDYYKRDVIQLSELTSAAYYLFNHNLSYGPMYLGWMSKIYQNQSRYDKLIDRIRAYSNVNLSVHSATFDESINGDDFLYLDPPYFLEKDSDNKMFKGIYPNANIDVHHTGFNHELLRDKLHNHKGKFVLSYNDCSTIREYYKGYTFVYPKWHYSYALGETRIGKNKTTNKPKQSHEILIIKP